MRSSDIPEMHVQIYQDVENWDRVIQMSFIVVITYLLGTRHIVTKWAPLLDETCLPLPTVLGWKYSQVHRCDFELVA